MLDKILFDAAVHAGAELRNHFTVDEMSSSTLTLDRSTTSPRSLATLVTPPKPFQQLGGAIHGNPEAMDEFVSLTAGTVSPSTSSTPHHIGRIMSEATVDSTTG